ncbi:GntR family transcriptional regulator [Saccharopolyspora taberi]|uniref:GntR family transcriptional regulator n=1 Tax=Saccharopolyspora taberi TaxID=60895 RepID=A0ABN3V0L4_9PSEU
MAKRTDDRPRHVQIAAHLRSRILSGDYEPGTKLPSTPKLMEWFDAASVTVQRAISMLKAEGFATSRAGAGVYVRNRQPFVVDVANYYAPSPGGYKYELLEVDEVAPPADVAQVFGLAEGETAILRKRVMRYDGEPVEMSWSYYPPDLARGTALAEHGKVRGGAPRVLADLGYPQRYFDDEVSVRAPETDEVVLLDLPSDVPVIRQLRVIYSDNERPVEASVLIKGGHLYALRYRQQIH